MRKYIPNEGDLVRLSANGLRQVHGLRSQEEIEAQMRGVRVLQVDPADTVPVCYDVELEAPFDKYLLTEQDVERLPGSATAGGV